MTIEEETYLISKERENPLFMLYALQVLNSYEYTVPSFTVFYEKVQHIVCQIIEDGDHLSMVDVFFKEDCVPQLIPPFSVNVLKFCYRYSRRISFRRPEIV